MITNRSVQTMLSMIGACLVAYFLYHTVAGDRGIAMQAQLQNSINAAQVDLARLQKQHQELDHRVHMMRPESLDPDLLDEEARKTLNVSKPDEIIILSPAETTKPSHKN